MRLIGMDGCPAGWVVAECELPDAGALPLPAPRFRIVRTFRELLASLEGQQVPVRDSVEGDRSADVDRLPLSRVRDRGDPAKPRGPMVGYRGAGGEGRTRISHPQFGAVLVCIDIPIGLPSGQPRDDGRRLVDRAAREVLGGQRTSSVFSAPCRPTFYADNYLAACASELAARGTKLSRQSFAIIPKIREVDEAITPTHQLPLDDAAVVRVREIHPEVTFAALRGRGEPGSGLVSRKRTREGEAERLALLQPYAPDLDPGAVRGSVSGAQRDDIVDAVAALVTAYRIVQGTAFSLPRDAVQLDERGLRMEMVG